MSNSKKFIQISDDETYFLMRIKFQLVQLEGQLQVYQKYKSRWGIAENVINSLIELLVQNSLFLKAYVNIIFQNQKINFKDYTSIDLDLDKKRIYYIEE